ncbi:zinc ribbon domain-containing protein [Azovibrio restrictus]|uniref:zinc ribbon domain-containing protein n=1 Tax=Azovibrio restrictus TaxID=146938 RepID=UPI0026E94B88|nr:zinc ribbon domain-containing protein [Azovibrio restrictus]MDD3482344.1 zinc ribbon domain-containing protein [Azovibrio restrictus]
MFCSSCGAPIQESDAFCGKCGAKVGAPAATPHTPAVTGSDGETDKLLAILAHLGGIFFGFIPALVLYLVKKDSPGWVLESVREALNWQITVIIASFVCFLLSFIIIGIFLFWVLLIANLVLCILAAVKTGDQVVYRYPFALRLIK